MVPGPRRAGPRGPPLTVRVERNFTFEEHPKQRQFAEAVFSGKYRYLFYGGAIRGGKSYGVMAVIFALCKLFPGSRWAIVRKDLPTLRRTILPVFDKLKPASFSDFNQSTWEAKHENGSTIILFPESHAGDKNYNRWRGLEVNGLWLEEANELQETSWHWALQRAGSYIIPRSVHNPEPVQPIPYILLTSNPAGNWVKTNFYTPWKRKQLKAPFYYLPATVHDNPSLSQAYLESLANLPERDYRVFVMGDWDLLTGQALEELNRDIHIIPDPYKAAARGRPPEYPEHWVRFGGFDWGYRHPFSFGLYLATEERIICVETIRGRGMADAQMVSYIHEVAEEKGIPATSLQYVVAGKDAFHDVQARMNVGETTAERFSKAGIPMMPADTSRISGLKNFREMTAWQKVGKGGTPGAPRFVWFDTPSNQKAFDVCANMVLDDTRPEDVLKVDANDNGEGGDDDYDQIRYALQSRAKAQPQESAEVGDDTHPGFNLKTKERRPRTRAPESPADDDLRPGWRLPEQPAVGRHKVPRWGQQNDADDMDLEDLNDL